MSKERIDLKVRHRTSIHVKNLSLEDIGKLPKIGMMWVHVITTEGKQYVLMHINGDPELGPRVYVGVKPRDPNKPTDEEWARTRDDVRLLTEGEYRETGYGTAIMLKEKALKPKNAMMLLEKYSSVFALIDIRDVSYWGKRTTKEDLGLSRQAKLNIYS